MLSLPLRASQECSVMLSPSLRASLGMQCYAFPPPLPLCLSRNAVSCSLPPSVPL